MEERNSQKTRTSLLVCLALMLIVLIGVTYAWLTQTLNGTKTNVIKPNLDETFKVTYDDDSSKGITLTSEQAVPLSDEQGKQADGYIFKVSNLGDIAVKFTVYLDNSTNDENGLSIDEANRIDDQHIKFLLSSDKHNSDTSALLNTTGVHPERKLYTGTLDADTNETFTLKLWIDQQATGEDVMNKVFAAKIRVEAIQADADVAP